MFTRSASSGVRRVRRCAGILVLGAAVSALIVASGASSGASSGPRAATPHTALSLAESVGNVCTLPPGQNCYSVQAFRNAYGISPLLKRGIDGRGRTVVIVAWLASAAPHSSATTNIFQDVSAFDSYFHLPPVKLTVVPGTTPKASADVAIGEEVEDVEMVHAVAPGAAIRVVLTGPRSYSASAAVSDLKDVVSASKGADVVSMSGGAWEDCFTPAQLAEAHSLISQLVDRHVTVTASSGDAGAADVSCSAPVGPVPKEGVQYPASDPLVLAVGGTTLVANPTTGSYMSETAWNSPNHRRQRRRLQQRVRPSLLSGRCRWHRSTARRARCRRRCR